jgi:ferredoxin--NADP+ reductase
MYEILEKKILSENVKLIKVKAPLVARKAKAGQFIILRIDEKGERIPLTIADNITKFFYFRRLAERPGKI